MQRRALSIEQAAGLDIALERLRQRGVDRAGMECHDDAAIVATLFLDRERTHQLIERGLRGAIAVPAAELIVRNAPDARRQDGKHCGLALAEGSHGDLGVIGKNDVVMILSYGGEAPELGALLNYISRKGNKLIAMTGGVKSSLAASAQVVLDVSVAREACPLELAPTASSTATLAMGDALAMAVMEAKGFSAEQFAEFHPGGSLGFKLTRVKDNMHTGLGFVLVPEATPVRKVFSMMSQKETRGAAGVIDQKGDLVGIITDGDIRRRLENTEDPFVGMASDMMTKNPRTVDANEIAEKALFLMEQFRINLLFVLDSQNEQAKKPVGILHIQDLLKNKIR